MTEQEILNKMKVDMALRGRSPDTIHDYLLHARIYQDYFNKPADLMREPEIRQFLHYLLTEKKDTPSTAYVAAGCIFQTVWNFMSGYDINYGINDIDIIYFDDTDLSYEAEARQIEYIAKFYNNIGYKLDVKNEAREHLWYHDKFGIHIQPYFSSESAINSWIPAAAIGVKYEKEKFRIYAPYGLNDLFGKIIRPNKLVATKEHFDNESKKWQNKWNDATIISW